MANKVEICIDITADISLPALSPEGDETTALCSKLRSDLIDLLRRYDIDHPKIDIAPDGHTAFEFHRNCRSIIDYGEQ